MMRIDPYRFGATCDPDFDRRILLINPTEGSAGAITGGNPLNDESSYAQSVAANNAAFSTTVTRHGRRTLELLGDNLFSGTNWPISTDFNLLDGSDATFEIDLYKTNSGASAILCARNTSNAAGGFALYTDRIRGNPGGGFQDPWTTWTEPPDNQWVHYALVVDSGTLYVYADGVAVAAEGFTGFDGPFGDYFVLGVGIWGGFVEDPTTGYAAKIRWSDYAVYPGGATFTPPNKHFLPACP